MSRWSEEWKKKLVEPNALCSWADEQRRHGKTIATLNGSFDLLHAGHLYIVHQAAQQADLLLLALNSDDSVRRYKGEERPFIALEERLQLVAALEFVSYVTWFNEEDPRELLRIVRPDVHVNGAEYGDRCIEREVVEEAGGRLHLVDRIPGLATSDIINRIASCVS